MPRRTARNYVPLAPVLHIFGSRSGISHLLHAPSANPSEIAIRTVQIFPMRATPARDAVWLILSDVATRRRPYSTLGARASRPPSPCRRSGRDTRAPRGEGGCPAQTLRSPRGQHNSGGVHGADIFDAHQPMAHGVLPDRHARASAPPRLHSLAIGAAVGDEVEELQGQGRCGGLLRGPGARSSGSDNLRTAIGTAADA